MRKNCFKRFAAGAAVLMLSICAVTGSRTLGADGHLVPGSTTENPVYCNNTYRTYIHVSYISSADRGQHIVSGGVGCNITEQMYMHQVYCSSCNEYMGTKSFFCTEVHSKCGTVIVNHPAH